MTEVDRLTRFAEAANRVKAEYEDGTRYNVRFSCGCTVKFCAGRYAGAYAGKGCHIEDGEGLRKHQWEPQP